MSLGDGITNSRRPTAPPERFGKDKAFKKNDIGNFEEYLSPQYRKEQIQRDLDSEELFLKEIKSAATKLRLGKYSGFEENGRLNEMVSKKEATEKNIIRLKAELEELSS